ncbi:MAG: response regulator transcription factor [Clostridia bacterium]|nr:response regulator transcription factor [Clostridia bacterium]MBQ2513034.1 response regulator transcription factor [Clostridia bacterium]
MKVLIVEDEVALSRAVKKILEQHGYVSDVVYDGRSALEFASMTEYNLVILDVMIPGMDGFSVIKELRKRGVNTPILVLTARADTEDKVNGLNLGADDYMTKPFDIDELLARVGALTRRKGEIVVDEIKFGDLTLDLASCVLTCGERSVRLSPKEFGVLKSFMLNPEKVIKTGWLLDNVWGVESEAVDNNVEVYVSFIRRKIKFVGSRVAIKRIQRVGYKMEKTL